MEPFSVKLEGKKLKITNNLDEKVIIIEINLKYYITVNMIDEKLGLRKLTESIKVDKEIGNNETLEITTKLEDISEISIVYKQGDIVKRVDISL
ncbi:MAG: hypothetical protein QW550_01080 [Saccharolobus sp.]